MKLTEIAQRINAHLKRFEADKTGVNKPNKPGGVSSYYRSYAGVGGRFVSVIYVTYQGHSSLTKREAEHYLSMLDAGFIGQHHEAFRKSPPSTPLLHP